RHHRLVFDDEHAQALEAAHASLSGSGASTVQTSPPGAKSILTLPPNSAASPRSIMRVPKPRRVGIDTGGPLRSVQVSSSRGPSGASPRDQRIATRPSGRDRAPCLTALVASSWIASARLIAVL